MENHPFLWRRIRRVRRIQVCIARKGLIPKTIGNRKRDCAWGCARGINTTRKNLQVEKHKSVRSVKRTPSWFVLFDLQIFSGGVYPPSAISRTISFSISDSFWNYWFIISDEKNGGAAGKLIGCFSALIPCHAIWQCKFYDRRMRTVSKIAKFLSTESVNSAPFKRGETKVQFFLQGKCKTLRQY